MGWGLDIGLGPQHIPGGTRLGLGDLEGNLREKNEAHKSPSLWFLIDHKLLPNLLSSCSPHGAGNWESPPARSLLPLMEAHSSETALVGKTEVQHC